MIQLIRNVKVYRDGAWRPSEILIAGSQIEAIADRIQCDYSGLEVSDGKGMTAIPGYIDQHVHVTGGGGEGSFITQVPPLKFSAPVKAGVTTLVGLLGTDGTTRSVANLVAKTKALREFGLTAYCLTGNYNYPSPTLTGSVMDDIVFVEEIIGVKIAISDHRSSNMTRESLIKLASDARVAGMLSGKPGIVHLHTGSGKAQLDMLFDIVEHTEIPIWNFRPTHLAAKYDAAIRFARLGGYIDFTCDPEDMFNRTALLVRAMEEAPDGLVTISTDRPLSTKLLMRDSTSCWLPKSRLAVGSSMIRMSGCCVRARAINTSCCCPPDSSVKVLPARCWMESWHSAASAMR